MSLLKNALALRHSGDNAGAAKLLEQHLHDRPDHALARYLLACCYDSQGLESKAVSLYEAGLAGELTPVERRSSYLGLGSSLRALGRYAEAEAALRSGLHEFPESNEIEVFLAMVEFNLGKSKLGMERLLRIVARTSSDERVRALQPAIELYARDLSATWSDA
jgi:tetratricopeptide (TPR) repeat protein